MREGQSGFLAWKVIIGRWTSSSERTESVSTERKFNFPRIALNRLRLVAGCFYMTCVSCVFSILIAMELCSLTNIRR